MIYLDNAATSWPKPEVVYQAVDECLRAGGNPSRGVNQSALNMSRVIFEARSSVAELFNVKNEEQIVFTKNITESLNLVLKSLLVAGDHVLISPVEHNSVVRPLQYLKETKDVEYDIIPGDQTGYFDTSEIEKMITKNTKLIVISHSSNVLGTILPVEEISQLAKKHNLYILVDAAQTAGVLPIDFEKLDIDFLAFTGHKGLLGPQGTGGLIVKEGISLTPLIHGGTGSKSKETSQLGLFPDDFESGTMNTPGIAGLKEGVRYCIENLEQIRKHEQFLIDKLLNYFKENSQFEFYGPQDANNRTGLVTFNIKDVDSDMVGEVLDNEFQIAVRTGLHCSPLAHNSGNTIDLGGVRVSVGPFTQEQEIDELINALEEISQNM
ncbi:aminotransferase class V-fold PLP-dependent enzyme [Natranaerobius trueperi]|uniref:cysteine desulfurase n=1 Tax=Natranaerobius trueperi TaxID=759412 RepID=A0A226C3H1_9FIRM|nr:aminotransferase class V-fold PLP-dependent enzyme [Natranaerobius trueperi]OWZ85019.1 cysteine desulfurase [Natranaerobius trueperi]